MAALVHQRWDAAVCGVMAMFFETVSGITVGVVPEGGPSFNHLTDERRHLRPVINIIYANYVR